VQCLLSVSIVHILIHVLSKILANPNVIKLDMMRKMTDYLLISVVLQ
jgi:hypothetical protein